MADDAEAAALGYLASHEWSRPVSRILLEGEVPGSASIFQVLFAEPVWGTDDALWVVVGDLPSAYMVLEAGETAAQVLMSYCELMEDWVHAVRTGGDLSMVFPVRADPSGAAADRLEARVAALREEMLDHLD